MTETKTLIPNAGHEHSDMGAGFIWAGALLMLGLLLACALGVLWLYPESPADRAPAPPLPTSSAPRRQADPAAAMRTFHAQQLQELDSLGWVDAQRKVLHIPIADAMRIVVHEGIPGWPAREVAP